MFRVPATNCTGNTMFENVPLFEGLSGADIEALSSRAITRNYRKNTIVIDQGDETDSLYVVISGRLKVFLRDEEGKEVILAFLNPGESFGELSLLDRSPRSASVETQEETKLAMISRTPFYEFLSSNIQVTINLLETLARRNRAATDSVGNLALLDVYGRVVRVLLKEAKEENGTLVTDKLTHQDIANMAGSSREMVSKIIKELKFGGYICVEQKRITINGKLPMHW